MLMLDRYLVAGGRALDLATGNSIRWQARRGDASAPPLFTARGRSWLIDFDRRGTARIEVWERTATPVTPEGDEAIVTAFRAVLHDARDGQPRAFDLTEASAARWTRTHRLLAREARLAGFVPMAADAVGAVLAQAHWRWPSWLRDRSLVVFATDTHLSADASLALFRLASKDARPHIVVRSVSGATWRPRVLTTAMHVHESAPSDGAVSPEGLIERADVLLGEGRLVDAEAAARWSLLLSTEGEVPARCALALALSAQGRPLEARAAVATLPGSQPETVRAEIARAIPPPRAEPVLVDTFLDILRSCQDEDDCSAALLKVAERLRGSLACSAVAFVLHDRQRAQLVAHAGAFTPSASQLSGALRVLDTAVAEPPSERGRLDEAAWPIRYGPAVVGALWCHWSIGVPLLPQDVAGLLGIAAIAAAPAMHQLRERLQAPQSTAVLPTLVGDSAAMDAVRQAVLRAARSPFPVLIEGESGSGKELVARAVHANSVRRSRKFCPLNCAAIADDLVEAELFGHTRGAFTGALAERVGLFEDAQGGTLFLDEVAELSARVQAKLLRTLQEHEVRRVGESSTRKVDARIVAATNRPLAPEVTAGRFRGDLRYRLDVLRISIPPLRERIEDVPVLVRHVWSDLSNRTGSRAVLSPSAMSLLGGYDWPGNVRELQNVLASVMVAGPARGVIGPQALPGHITRATAVATRASLAQARQEFEARFVRAALARAGGSVMLAARELGISRQGLTKLTARLGLDAHR